MRSIMLVAAVCTLFAGVARADEARLTGLPAALLGGAAAQGTQHQLPEPPFTSVSAGGLSAVLGQTTLNDVANALGGSVSTAGEGSQAASWICYTATVADHETYVWFLSNGGTADGALDLVGANFRDPAGKGQSCVAPKVSLDAINFSVPGLGENESALQERFGVVSARYGFVAYLNQEGSVMQNLNYLIKNDIIIGIAVTRVSAQ